MTQDKEKEIPAIIQTVGKHLWDFLASAARGAPFQGPVKRGLFKGGTRVTKKSKTTKDLPAQPEFGLQVLGGGCVGEMFRTLKRQRRMHSMPQKKAKGHGLNCALSGLIVLDKKKAKSIPVDRAD